MKMLNSIKFAVFAAAIATGSSLSADDDWIDFETRIVKDRDDVQLDESKAYILLQTPAAVPATFFRVPSDEEREINARLRAQAYAEAREKWEQEMIRYEKSVEAFEKRRRSHRPKKPPLLTETNFGWPSVEQSLMVSLGPLNRFAKSKENSLYLQEVPPGEYVYYGTIMQGLGACACMGTVKFTAEAGKITTLRYDGVWLDKDSNPLTRGKLPKGIDTDDALVRVAMIVEPADEDVRDPRLPGDWIVAAEFVPVPFVPNWYGAEINRLYPIKGVLAYDRDRVIDVKAEQAIREELEIAEQTEAGAIVESDVETGDANVSSIDDIDIATEQGADIAD